MRENREQWSPSYSRNEELDLQKFILFLTVKVFIYLFKKDVEQEHRKYFVGITQYRNIIVT